MTASVKSFEDRRVKRRLQDDLAEDSGSENTDYVGEVQRWVAAVPRSPQTTALFLIGRPDM